jgi:hypothetical protein
MLCYNISFCAFQSIPSDSPRAVLEVHLGLLMSCNSVPIKEKPVSNPFSKSVLALMITSSLPVQAESVHVDKELMSGLEEIHVTAHRTDANVLVNSNRTLS